MELQQKLEILNEIKRIERELYLKKSQLASAEAMEHDASVYEGLDKNKWKKVFSQCIEEVGLYSRGGNSIEDIKMERRR